MSPLFGGVAQLAERFGRIEEARGSIPLTSTKTAGTWLLAVWLCFTLFLAGCSDRAPAPTTDTTEPTTTTDAASILDRDYAELVSITEELRGLKFRETPKLVVLTPEALAQRVREDFFKDYENVEADDAIYTLLGIIDPSMDLEEFLLDLYSEQVAGFYDLESKEMVVPMSGERMSPLEKATLVHELVHALTDQVFDLWPAMKALDDGQQYDALTGLSSVLEGDATRVQTDFLSTLSIADLTDLVTEAQNIDTTVFDAAPLFIVESILFPYTAGQELVTMVFAEGGIEAVNALYLNPPVSTEQVIELNLNEAVAAVPEWELTVEGYELVYDSDWGLLGFQLLFRQILGTTSIHGWGGDRFVAWFDGENVVLVFDVVLDAGPAAAAFDTEMDRYLRAITGVGSRDGVFMGEKWASLARNENRITAVIADVEAAGELVAGGLG